jgi:hypothetical protein
MTPAEAKKLFGRKRHKYGVSKAEERTHNGLVFDSKLEMKFHRILETCLPGHPIARQVLFELQPSARSCPDGKVVRGIHYKADFVLGPLGHGPGGPFPLPGCMVIDAKGVRTDVFDMLAKMFWFRFGQTIRILKTEKALLETISHYKNFMETNEILKLRAADGKPFGITDYVNSAGQASNLRVRFLGREGYLDLVRRSLDTLTGLPAPEDAGEAWATAVAEVETSLRKALGEGDNPGEGRTERASHETLVPLCEGLALKDGKAEDVVLFRLEILERESIGSEEKKASASRNEVSAAKKRINALLPLDAYCHRLNLYAGRYGAVTE